MIPVKLFPAKNGNLPPYLAQYGSQRFTNEFIPDYSTTLVQKTT
jgi:hypothetical protein